MPDVLFLLNTHTLEISMRFKQPINALALSVFVTTAQAAADLQITEIYFGLDGNDGTADWFELTNFGDTSVDTGTLWYDDESADVGVADPLSSIVLDPGVSAVFVIDVEAAIDTFKSVWGTGLLVGFVDGAGLGQSGDTVNIFDGNQPGSMLLDSAGYPDLGGTNLATWSLNKAGTGRFTQPGDPGAYLSNPFENAGLAVSGTQVQLLGSPGVGTVPLPPAFGLMFMGLGALWFKGRRKA